MSIVNLSIVTIAVSAGALLMTSGADALHAAPAAAPNPVRGKQLFLQCQACHTMTPGAANSVGPNLSGIVGTKAGSRPGYAYSPAMSKSGITWSAATLDPFLKRPSQVVRGTKMAFGGMMNPKARADIIAYLGTVKGR